jgi:glucose/arabinose dehydrogenase
LQRDSFVKRLPISGTLAQVRAKSISIALLMALMLVPAAALAHRRATKAERHAVLAAIVRQRQLSGSQAACQVVTISTVNQAYASATWPAKLSKTCQRVAANGVIIEHRTKGRWRFVTVGSSFQCPIKGVPTRVARDLGVCS